MQKAFFHCFLIGFIILFSVACGSSRNKQAPKINKPILYNPASSSLHPLLGVFHISEKESQLYIQLNTNELIVNEANAEGVPKADLRIHYQLFDCTEIENNKIVSDSATFINSIEIKKQQRTIVFPIMIPVEQGHRYLLLVQITDLIRRNTVREFITVNKLSETSPQNFKITALNGAPKLEKNIRINDVFRIVYQRRPVDRIFIKYSASQAPIPTSPLAPAPITDLSFKPDSIWEQSYSPNTNFMFGYEGIYLIQTDTTHQEGLLLRNFGPSFPRENRTAILVQPINYLASESEYRKLSEAENPKKMLDNFWLATTGSTDKARMQIRVFYTRMSYANQYFSDTREGWKTDRGMVYMVYGLPNNVFKGSDSETWEYTRKQSNPVTFTFDRKPLPYCDEYYVLRRGDPQTTYWSLAIESWRNGRVFSLNDIE
ncbi:MAG: GWxTD domain-containing protein [Bacteroidales bacterium]|jgi:GWxTD domain-containing protein|nr:GWxTD domain-containing protein [Bacteroidales bacterium]